MKDFLSNYPDTLDKRPGTTFSQQMRTLCLGELKTQEVRQTHYSTKWKYMYQHKDKFFHRIVQNEQTPPF